NSSKFNVNLSIPSKGSIPTKETRIPKETDSKPLIKEPSSKLATAHRPNNINEKFSQGPKASAHCDRKGAATIKIIPEMIVPIKDDHNPKDRALPGSPFFAIGYPSNVVATAEGVPGIPKRQAVIKPPEFPPTCTPIKRETPFIGSIP